MEDEINKYGAKFFIGQLIKVVRPLEFYKSDKGKVGRIDGISGNFKSGFEYSIGSTNACMTAWYNENQLDFISEDEKEEWNENGKRIRDIIKKEGGAN